MGRCIKASQVRGRAQRGRAREIQDNCAGRVGVLGGALEFVVPIV